MELNTIVSISGSLSPKIKNLDLDKCLLFSYQFKSEIETAQQQESLDELVLDLFSRRRYPNVSVGVVQRMGGGRIMGDKNDRYVFLNVNIPVFEGGGTFSRLKQGKIKLRESVIKRAKAESEMKLDVNKSFMEYDFWRKQTKDAKLLEKNGHYDKTDINIIYNLNKSYYNLELAIGVELDSYLKSIFTFRTGFFYCFKDICFCF